MSRRPPGFNLMDRLKSIEQSKKKRRRSSSDKSRKKTRRSGTNRRTATVTSELLKFPQDIGELIGDHQRKSYIKKGIRPLPKNVRKQMKQSQFDKDKLKSPELQKLFMMHGIEFIPEEKPKASKRRKKTRHRKKHKKHRKKHSKKHRKKSRKKKRTKHR